MKEFLVWTSQLFFIVLVALVLKSLLFRSSRKPDPGKRDHFKESKFPPQKGSIAIVIGAGLAGMSSAAVLSRYFEQVVILERDNLSKTNFGPRKGTPQSYWHSHALQGRAMAIYETLFPGLRERMIKGGGYEVEYIGSDLRFFFETNWINFPDGLERQKTVFSSRGFLEEHIRLTLLSTYTNVTIQDSTTVTGLTVSEKNHVTGVKFFRNNTSKEERSIEELKGSLVVEAGGKWSNYVSYLTDLGFKEPKTLEIDPKGNCISTVISRPPADSNRWRGLLLLFSYRNQPRYPWSLGALVPLERDRWTASILYTGDTRSLTTREEFIEACKNLETDFMYQIVKDAAFLEPIHVLRIPTAKLRRFESLPEGFIVTGDSVCSTNPFYGLGMTVAACSAEILDECLQDYYNGNSMEGFNMKFQKRLPSAYLPAWMTNMGDIRHPDVKLKGEESVPLFIFKILCWVFDRAIFGCLLSNSNSLLKEITEAFSYEVAMSKVLSRPKFLIRSFYYYFSNSKKLQR